MFDRNKEKPDAKYDVKYISGHSMHPKEKDTQALFFADRLELKNLEISIPYTSITKLSGQEDRHITKTRVFMTGIIPGLFWKKIYRYTVIEYNDGFMDQSILLDFHKDAEKIQKGLYQNMIDAKKQVAMVLMNNLLFLLLAFVPLLLIVPLVNAQTDQDVKNSCLVMKSAIVNASKFPQDVNTPEFNSSVTDYNTNCVNLTGALPPK